MSEAVQHEGIDHQDRHACLNLLREYPRVVSEIRVDSPALPNQARATALSAECHRLNLAPIVEDVGRPLTPDEQGAIIRWWGTSEPLALVVRHLDGNLSAWCNHNRASVWTSRPDPWHPQAGDEVIWMADE